MFELIFSSIFNKLFLATGKMPVPQPRIFLVEQASCLFLIFLILVPQQIKLYPNK